MKCHTLLDSDYQRRSIDFAALSLISISKTGNLHRSAFVTSKNGTTLALSACQDLPSSTITIFIYTSSSAILSALFKVSELGMHVREIGTRGPDVGADFWQRTVRRATRRLIENKALRINSRERKPTASLIGRVFSTSFPLLAFPNPFSQA